MERSIKCYLARPISALHPSFTHILAARPVTPLPPSATLIVPHTLPHRYGYISRRHRSVPSCRRSWNYSLRDVSRCRKSRDHSCESTWSTYSQVFNKPISIRFDLEDRGCLDIVDSIKHFASIKIHATEYKFNGRVSNPEIVFLYILISRDVRYVSACCWGYFERINAYITYIRCGILY